MRERLPRDLAEYKRHHRNNQYFWVDEEGFYCFKHYWSPICRIHKEKKIIEFGYNYDYSSLTKGKLGDFIHAFAPWFFKEYKGASIYELIESGEFEGEPLRYVKALVGKTYNLCKTFERETPKWAYSAE